MKKYIYLSSGKFGVEVLSNLKNKPDLVLTQPDRLGGRGLKQLFVTPVKQYCQQNQLNFTETLSSVKFTKYDLALVADYGKIIPDNLLTQPKLGFFNIHPSLLPKYRGSSPLQTALLNDEKQTGVSIIKMDEKVDHGPVVAQKKLEIDVNDNYLSLLKKTAILGAKLFSQINWERINPVFQNHQKATYTKKLNKQDGYIPIEQLIPYLTPIFTKYNLLHLLPNQAEKPIDPKKLHNLIRGLTPWPGMWCKSSDKRLLIKKADYTHTAKGLKIKRIQIGSKEYEL